jgi:TonB family protein
MGRNPFIILDIHRSGGSLPLDGIKVAAPCKAEWKWMQGNDRVRFCGQCNLNVFNLSAMSTEEAEDLIRRADGTLCVRFYKRNDGTIMTRNCPVGLQAIRDKLTSTRTHIIAAVLSFLGYLGFLGAYKVIGRDVETGKPAAVNYDREETIKTTWLKNPFPAYPVQVNTVMGSIAPICLAGPSLATRGESFIRQRAILKVIPIYHSTPLQNGNVVVRIVIDEDGIVDEAECTKGNPVVKDLAEEAARQWRFEPTVINGRPVRIESVLTFRINN